MSLEILRELSGCRKFWKRRSIFEFLYNSLSENQNEKSGTAFIALRTFEFMQYSASSFKNFGFLHLQNCLKPSPCPPSPCKIWKYANERHIKWARLQLRSQLLQTLSSSEYLPNLLIYIIHCMYYIFFSVVLVLFFSIVLLFCHLFLFHLSIVFVPFSYLYPYSIHAFTLHNYYF